jgi:hypothetical protein
MDKEVLVQCQQEDPRESCKGVKTDNKVILTIACAIQQHRAVLCGGVSW